jgi:SAM-dependent methyltransferase
VLLTGPGIRHGDSGKPWRDYDPTSSGRHWGTAKYMYDKYRDLTGDDLSKYPMLQRFDKLDEAGLIHWSKKKGGGVPNYKYYLDDAPGVYLQDIWAYQPGTEGCVYGKPNECIDQDVKWLSTLDKERLGYPTQKPEGVLERIIRSSSGEGQLVLDPFCGCGTAVAVAQRLNRRWVGIDVTWLAIDKIERRLAESFGKKARYLVKGNPVDVASAMDLANRSKKEFEIWALYLVHAAQREHDGGVDGLLSISEGNKKYAKVVVQVKGGEVLVPEMIRALDGTVTKEKAVIGLFISLQDPTTGMKETAVHYGSYMSPVWGKSYPRIQIRTIQELLVEHKPFDLPPQVPTLKQAERVKEQGTIEPML